MTACRSIRVVYSQVRVPDLLFCKGLFMGRNIHQRACLERVNRVKTVGNAYLLHYQLSFFVENVAEPTKITAKTPTSIKVLANGGMNALARLER